MTGQIHEDRFPTSGCPTFLEWYKCYDDPARAVWIDGMELRTNRDSWDEKQCAKWHYFYRPIRAAIGRPQQGKIRERERSIFVQEEKLKQLQNTLIRDLVLCLFGLFLAGWIWEYLIPIPLVIAAARAASFALERRKRLARIEAKRAEVDLLHGEIRHLSAQVVDAPTTQEIESWLSEEIPGMERKCLAEIVNMATDDPRLFDTIRHEQVEARNNPYGLQGLLIEGWGPLQPATIRGPFGEERTGIHRVASDIGSAIATWRPGTRGQPIYRVMYLQYIFLLERNVNVYGFFYDFVTRKQYGKRTETFQYNHVTNYSIREVELAESDWISHIDVPEVFRSDLMQKEINAFSLAVSSGAYFRCVLSDDTVVDAINRWLSADEQVREWQVQPEPLSADSDGGTGGLDTSSLADRWEEEDRKKKDEFLREMAQYRRQLEEQDIHLARRALQQVREEVENYVQWVQTAAPQAGVTGEDQA